MTDNYSFFLGLILNYQYADLKTPMNTGSICIIRHAKKVELVKIPGLKTLSNCVTSLYVRNCVQYTSFS